jgi:thiamine transporter
MKNKRVLRLQMLVEGGLVAAVCMALSFVPLQTLNASFDLSLGMILALVYSIRWGAGPGILACLVWGLLHFVIPGKVYFLSIPQVVIEYILAFSFAGFGGLLSKTVKSAIQNGKSFVYLGSILVCASVLGVGARWLWHFVAGIVFWGSYAPEGMPVVLYSLVFNGASFIANAIYVSILLIIVTKVRKNLFFPE